MQLNVHTINIKHVFVIFLLINNIQDGDRGRNFCCAMLIMA